ncbi:MAG: hypothetical protein ACK4UJ_08675 [Leptonema sp. (in: bacteria)]
MKKKPLMIFLFFTLSVFAQENLNMMEKVIIKVDELEEEVPGYKTFSIYVENPFEENKTILGYIEFENGEQCLFFIEVQAKSNQTITRHCNVKKKRLKYEVKIEKIYPFIIKE